MSATVKYTDGRTSILKLVKILTLLLAINKFNFILKNVHVTYLEHSKSISYFGDLLKRFLTWTLNSATKLTEKRMPLNACKSGRLRKPEASILHRDLYRSYGPGRLGQGSDLLKDMQIASQCAAAGPNRSSRHTMKTYARDYT